MLDLHHLPGSQPGEQTKRILRRHWFTVLPLVFFTTIVFLLPVAIYFVILFFSPGFFEEQLRSVILAAGVSIFFLFAWLFMFQNFLDYYLDVWITTDQRILNIEQNGLFARTVSELRLHRVQDVTSKIEGFFNTMLDFGDVIIQTAGEREFFRFEDVPHPAQVAKEILDLAEIQRRKHLEEAVEEFGMPTPKKQKPSSEDEGPF